MAEQTLTDILNECIEQLAAGQNVDACLRLYPNHAARLRPMLESGQLVGRMGYPMAEVAAAQEQIWSRVEQAYNAPQSARPIRFPRQYLWLAAVLAALLILAGVIAAARNSSPGDPLYGIRVFIESIVGGQAAPTATPTSAPTQTPVSTETALLTMTNTVAPTQPSSASPTVSQTPMAVSSATPFEATAEVTESPTGVIEGPVEAINGTLIVIYGIEIRLDPNDPILAVIQVGDVIRVEGSFGEAGAVVVLTNVRVIEIDVEGVFINSESGEVWRDDGTCNNPPPDWATANGWRRRCQSGAANGNGNTGGNSDGMGMGMGSGSDS